MTNSRSHQRPPAESGSITLELAILTPAMLVLIGLVIVAGRLTVATSTVQQASEAAAREASLARTPATATAAALNAARANLQQGGLACAPVAVVVDTSGFRITVGRPAQVTVQVSCTVSLSGLGVPGLPGQRTLSASSVSVLDTYRSRTS